MEIRGERSPGPWNLDGESVVPYFCRVVSCSAEGGGRRLRPIGVGAAEEAAK